jgi:hypothetical protein
MKMGEKKTEGILKKQKWVWIKKGFFRIYFHKRHLKKKSCHKQLNVKKSVPSFI